MNPLSSRYLTARYNSTNSSSESSKSSTSEKTSSPIGGSLTSQEMALDCHDTYPSSSDDTNSDSSSEYVICYVPVSYVVQQVCGSLESYESATTESEECSSESDTISQSGEETSSEAQSNSASSEAEESEPMDSFKVANLGIPSQHINNRANNSSAHKDVAVDRPLNNLSPSRPVISDSSSEHVICYVPVSYVVQQVCGSLKSYESATTESEECSSESDTINQSGEKTSSEAQSNSASSKAEESEPMDSSKVANLGIPSQHINNRANNSSAHKDALVDRPLNNLPPSRPVITNNSANKEFKLASFVTEFSNSIKDFFTSKSSSANTIEKHGNQL